MLQPNDSDFPARASRSFPPLSRAIGNTPLLPLEFRDTGLTIFAKAEFLNPSGSIKDRLALAIFHRLHAGGRLHPATTVLEVSSGNTGIALAALGAALGCRVHILMSDTAAPGARRLIRHFGARLTLFRADEGYLTGIALAERMAAADPSIFLPRQFENPINVDDHARTTGPEILRQIPGRRVDAFVCGYGTGGTLAGCGYFFRSSCPGVQLAAIEPAGTGLALVEMPCCQPIEGLGGTFHPPLLRATPVDHHLSVLPDEALAMARRVAAEFGLAVGPSSGANVVAALRLARELGPRARVATVLCDRADRYFDSTLFQPPTASDFNS